MNYQEWTPSVPWATAPGSLFGKTPNDPIADILSNDNRAAISTGIFKTGGSPQYLVSDRGYSRGLLRQSDARLQSYVTSLHQNTTTRWTLAALEATLGAKPSAPYGGPPSPTLMKWWYDAINIMDIFHMSDDFSGSGYNSGSTGDAKHVKRWGGVGTISGGKFTTSVITSLNTTEISGPQNFDNYGTYPVTYVIDVDSFSPGSPATFILMDTVGFHLEFVQSPSLPAGRVDVYRNDFETTPFTSIPGSIVATWKIILDMTSTLAGTATLYKNGIEKASYTGSFIIPPILSGIGYPFMFGNSAFYGGSTTLNSFSLTALSDQVELNMEASY